jgi:Flp pilus assembly protein protease CpaA
VEVPPGTPQGSRYVGVELWLHRITVLTFGLVCAVVGVLLVILPWRPEWTDNHLLMASPGLRALVANGFVRGVCSGLGILDIWIGFSEAIHYHEEKRP